jgi:hypothetical protein
MLSGGRYSYEVSLSIFMNNAWKVFLILHLQQQIIFLENILASHFLSVPLLPIADILQLIHIILK